MLSCLLAACTSPGRVVHRAADPGPVRATGQAFASCVGPPPDDAASVPALIFGPGGAVVSAAEQDASVHRDSIKLETGLTTRAADGTTTLSTTARLQGHLLDVPGWAHATAGGLASATQADCAVSTGEVLADVLLTLDAENRVGTASVGGAPPVEVLAAAGDEPLVAAFRDVFNSRTPWSRRPTSLPYSETEPAVKALAAALDPTTQERLAAVVEAMAYAERARLAAVAPWYPVQPDYRELEAIFSSLEVPPVRARSFGYATMGRAGAVIALAVERLQSHLVLHPLPPDLDTVIATPLGEVVLSGRHSDDNRTLTAPAVVVDQAGNDTYRGFIAGSSMPAVPLSVLIDLAGDDTYLAGGVTGTQGAGVLSFGFLLDRGGDDRYEATSTAQGAAMLGVGALYDGGGDDRYQAAEFAQGAGRYGLGAAVDLSGNDSWRLTSFGQGFGFVRGVGLLLDAQGDDSYDADDTTITNPSPQSAAHNASFAQGAGFGQRTSTNSTSLAGGLGLLVDLAGHDAYSCGVFCQGTGYYFGHGVLYDGGGDDSYRGVWYVQGSGAHFALATLLDESGNDTYETVEACSRGAGHDESAGFFVDGAGDDHYVVARVSNGATSDVGFGFFVDVAGADTYTTVDVREPGRYGQATVDGDFANYRSGYDGARALAVFLDLGGDDRYLDAPAPVTNSSHWKLAGAVSPRLGSVPMPPAQIGVGRDLG